MSTLLHDWDKGSNSKRKKLLKWFYSHFHSNRDRDRLLELKFGADIALFLPRLLAWMQKTSASEIPCTLIACQTTQKSTVAQCFALSEQVACLSVFIDSVYVHHYYQEFQYAEGLEIVLKIVAIEGNKFESQKPLVSLRNREILLCIILRISKMSRQCKKEISSRNGEFAVLHGVLASGDNNDWNLESRVWTLCRQILLEQLVENILSIDRTHEVVVFMLQSSIMRLQLFGAQILRSIISKDSFSFNFEYRQRNEMKLVPLCVSLLKATDVYLQHENTEILLELLHSKHLQDVILKTLVHVIEDSARDQNARVEERFVSIEETKEYETYAHLHAPFFQVSQAMNYIIKSNRSLLPAVVNKYDLLTPFAFVLVIERSHSLKWYAAATNLSFIFSHYFKGVAVQLCDLFEISNDELLKWKDKQDINDVMFAEFLLGDPTRRKYLIYRFYQRGWYRPLLSRKHFDADWILHDIEHYIEITTRDYIPQLQSHKYVGESEEESEEMVKREHCFRSQLQHHFALFSPRRTSQCDLYH
ncbi:hypothetical protein Plhal304r1_c033g0104751 [Plasmopara halstedii]